MNRQATGVALTRHPPLILLAGGTLGICGILVSAAGAHKGGGELAATAGQFCLVHGAALLGLASAAQVRRFRPWMVLSAAFCLCVGTLLFSGDLALSALLQWRPFPLAAPLGGILLIAGWALVIATALLALIRAES